MKNILIGLGLSIISSTSIAGFWTGNDLYKWMNNPHEITRAYSYIAAVSDAESDHTFLNAITTYKQNQGKTEYFFFCVPSEVTVGQMTDVVKQYLQNNPKNRHISAATLIRSALLDAWPCSTNKDQK